MAGKWAMILVVSAAALVLPSPASAAPPTSQPYRVTGEWRSTEYVGPIIVEWLDSAGGWLCDPGSGLVLFTVDGSSIVTGSNGWTGDWSTGVVGRAVVGTDGRFIPMAVDYGLGSEIDVTMIYLGAGVATGIVLIFVVEVISRIASPIRVFGQGIVDS